MLKKIDEIYRAMENNCYHCALALCLTLPDICAKIAYPEISKLGEAYELWFNKNVLQSYHFPNGSEIINGKTCYLLRCAFLHSGNFDLKKRHKDVKIQSFLLHIGKTNKGYNDLINVIYKTCTDAETGEKKIIPDKIYCDIDVELLCRNMCLAVKKFYNSIEDKSVFNDEYIVDSLKS